MLCVVHAHCGQHRYWLRALGFSGSPSFPDLVGRNQEGAVWRVLTHLAMAGREIYSTCLFLAGGANSHENTRRFCRTNRSWRNVTPWLCTFVALTRLVSDRQIWILTICSVSSPALSYDEGWLWLAAGPQQRANQCSSWMSNICPTICFLPVEFCALSWKCYQSACFIIWFEWLMRPTGGCSLKRLNIQRKC